MTEISSTVEFRFAAIEDCDEIGAFLTELGGPLFHERFPDGTAGDLYRWKLFSSPWGEGIAGLAMERGRIVAMAAAMPKPVQFSGRAVKGYELGDFFTAREFRGRGYFGRLIDMVCAEAGNRGGELTYVRPNDQSFPLLLKRGFEQAQQMNERHFAAPSRAINRRLPGSAGMVRALGGDALARWAALPKPGPDVPVERVARFGPEMDDLWQRAAARFGFSLIRGAEYLNWRFADSPAPFELWVARLGREAVGCAVTFRSATGLGFLVDLFTLPEDQSAASALVRHCANHLLNTGCHAIYCSTVIRGGPLAVQTILPRFCPRLDLPVRHVVMRGTCGAQLPRVNGVWQLTMGDFDGF